MVYFGGVIIGFGPDSNAAAENDSPVCACAKAVRAADLAHQKNVCGSPRVLMAEAVFWGN